MSRELTKLCLHLTHPTRDLASVCNGLDLVPLVIRKKGDARKAPGGRLLGGKHASSFCSIPLGGRPRELLAKKIRSALLRLKPHKRALRMLSAAGGGIVLFVGWFCDRHTGGSLDAGLLKEASDLRIGIDLNIYVTEEPLRASARKGR